MAALPNFAPRIFAAPEQWQVRLHPRYAHLYPEIPPGIWVTATSAAWVVLGGILGRTRSWPCPGPRVLGQEHFIFRGGDCRVEGWLGPNSRSDDL